MNIPFTPDLLRTPAAAALMAAIIRLWLIQSLQDWRWRDLVLLGLTIGAEILAAAATGALSDPAQAFTAVWVGVIGASIATFGMEAITNLAGLADVGPRSTNNLLAQLGAQWRSWR